MDGQDRKIGTNGVDEHKHGGIKMSITSRIITVLAVAGLFVVNMSNADPGYELSGVYSDGGDGEDLSIGDGGQGSLELWDAELLRDVVFIGRNQDGDGLVEITGGLLRGQFIHVGRDDPSAVGRIKMTDGILRVHDGTGSANRLTIGSNGGGTGYFEMDGGTLDVNVNLLRIGLEGNGTFDMRGGTVDLINPGDNNFVVGMDGGTGTFNMHGGSINYSGSSNNELNVGGAHGVSGGTGTFNMYGGSLVGIRDLRVGHASSAAVGTFNHFGGTTNVERIWAGYDGGTATFNMYLSDDFEPLTATGTLFTRDDSHLGVRLHGGVLLSGKASHDLLQAGRQDGSWDSRPQGGENELWDTESVVVGGDIVWRASLNEGLMRGEDNLNAAEIDEPVSLDGQFARGYIPVENLNQSEPNQLQLALGFAGEGSGVEEEAKIKGLIGDFTADLASAGYVWYARASDFEIGLDMSVVADEDGFATFAWDFSDYQTENPSQLELSSITVIPEPSSIGLIVLWLAAAIRLRLRGRRNF